MEQEFKGGRRDNLSSYFYGGTFFYQCIKYLYFINSKHVFELNILTILKYAEFSSYIYPILRTYIEICLYI